MHVCELHYYRRVLNVLLHKNVGQGVPHTEAVVIRVLTVSYLVYKVNHRACFEYHMYTVLVLVILNNCKKEIKVTSC